jgi:hypothetical protein
MARSYVSFDGNNKAKRTGNSVYASMPSGQNVKTNFQGYTDPLAPVESGMNLSNAYEPSLRDQISPNVNNINSYQNKTRLNRVDGSDGAQNSFNWMGKDGVLIPGLTALAGGVEAFTGFKQYKETKKNNAFNRAAIRNDVYNRARVSDQTLDNNSRMRARSKDMSPEATEAYVAEQKRKFGVRGTFA